LHAHELAIDVEPAATPATDASANVVCEAVIAALFVVLVRCVCAAADDTSVRAKTRPRTIRIIVCAPERFMVRRLLRW
jgi:hypothetical protein